MINKNAVWDAETLGIYKVKGKSNDTLLRIGAYVVLVAFILSLI